MSALTSRYPWRAQRYTRDGNLLFKEAEEITRETGKPTLALALREVKVGFDEVKLAHGLSWNSSDHVISGLPTSTVDFTYLTDIYREVTTQEGHAPAKYALLFLCASVVMPKLKFIMGYVLTETNLTSGIVVKAVLEALRILVQYRFIPVLIVADGASTNTAAYKILMGHGRGQIKTKDFEPVMTNPWDDSLPEIMLCLCSVHGLKRVVNTLYSSRLHGSKAFQMEQDGVRTPFGWLPLVQMAERELRRVAGGGVYGPGRLPGLKMSYIHRDA